MSEPVRPATRELLRRLADAGPPDLRAALRLRGAVASVADGVAQVVGLQGVGSDELVVFSSGVLGMAYELEPGRTGVVLLDASERVRAADGVEALGRTPALAVGSDLLGRAIDPLGRPLDDGPVIRGASRPLFREAPRLSERAPVERPLLTGVMVIDAAIPIGRGQRQLVVGDRNVGKTSLALDIVAAQRPGDVFCVYVLVGQPMSRMLGVLESLRDCGALANTVIVAADAATAPGLQYLAPYAGAAIAEFFAERGSDALVVYDDLTKHADAYRELALLLGRAPGREAFPGDIFHIHAQLLERATARSAALGGGSVTAFPIVETTDGDISAYIPTNLISITDGQLYLDTIRFERNQRPAIDLGRSVSRVGGAAQSPPMRRAARNLRIVMSRFETLESLTRVGLDVDPATRTAVERGLLVRGLLRQPRFTPRTVAQQILALTAANAGWLDELAPATAADHTWAALDRVAPDLPETVAALENGTEPPDGWDERLHDLIVRHTRSSP